MLEGLDAIDWGRLRHAYGPAADVPGLVRALASDEPAERADALYELFGNVWHQGSVYEATAHVVPFLVELAASPRIVDRADILFLLVEIADGRSYRAAHEGLRVWEGRRGTPEHEAEKARELEWVHHAHAAVAHQTDTFLMLVERDPDAQVRAAAACVTGRLWEHTAEISPRLGARIAREGDATARANLLLALGRLRDVAAIPAIDAALGDSSRLVVLAAAIARARLPPPSPACIEALLQCIDDPGSIDAEDMRFDHGDASVEACAALMGLGAMAAGVLPRLAQILGRCDPFRATDIGDAMLEIGFAADEHARYVVVTALAEAEPFWAAKSERLVRAQMLEDRGLPKEREALRRCVVPVK